MFIWTAFAVFLIYLCWSIDRSPIHFPQSCFSEHKSSFFSWFYMRLCAHTYSQQRTSTFIVYRFTYYIYERDLCTRRFLLSSRNWSEKTMTLCYMYICIYIYINMRMSKRKKERRKQCLSYPYLLLIARWSLSLSLYL